MTIKQAVINVEKELRCRNDGEERYCENHECCDECPAYVSYRDFTDALQILHDWFCELLNEKKDGSEDK